MLLVMGHVVVAGTWEIRMGVWACCNTGEVDINRMQSIRATASHSRIIRCMHIQEGNKAVGVMVAMGVITE